MVIGSLLTSISLPSLLSLPLHTLNLPHPIRHMLSGFSIPWINYQREAVLLHGKHWHKPLLEAEMNEWGADTWVCTRYCVLPCSAGAFRGDFRRSPEISGECVILRCSVHLDWDGLREVPVIRFDANTQAAKAYLWSTGVAMNRRCEGRWKEQHSATNIIRQTHTHEILSDSQWRSHKEADQ